MILDPEPVKEVRGSYTKFTAERRAVIGKRAAEHGVATIRYIKKQFSDMKESNVRTWRSACTSEIRKRLKPSSQWSATCCVALRPSALL